MFCPIFNQEKKHLNKSNLGIPCASASSRNCEILKSACVLMKEILRKITTKKKKLSNVSVEVGNKKKKILCWYMSKEEVKPKNNVVLIYICICALIHTAWYLFVTVIDTGRVQVYMYSVTCTCKKTFICQGGI